MDVGANKQARTITSIANAASYAAGAHVTSRGILKLGLTPLRPQYPMAKKLYNFCCLLAVLISCSPITLSQAVRVTTQRIHATQIFEYRGYKDVEMFHFLLPEQTLEATWNFTAREYQQWHCEPRNVSVYLRPGSYPVVSPYGAEFPENIRRQVEEEIVIQLISDAVSVTYTISVPEPGDWFAIAFVHAESDRIKQKGLSPYCSTVLEAQLDIEWVNNTILVIPEVQNYQEILLYQDIEASQQVTYKFYVPADTRLVLLNISWCKPAQCPLVVLSRARGLPDQNDVNTNTVNCSASQLPGTCNVEMLPWEEEWHYVTVQAPVSNASFALKVVFYTCIAEIPVPRYLLLNCLDNKNSVPSQSRSSKMHMFLQASQQQLHRAAPELCWEAIPLIRNTFPGSFTFEYDLQPDENGTTPLKLDVSTNATTIMNFNINPVTDIGGTLNFELGLSPTLNTSVTNFSVVACLTFRGRYEPTWEDGLGPSCGEDSEFSLIHVNTSGSLVGKPYSFSRMLVPYPSPGTWHLSVRTYCYVTNADLNVTAGNVEVVECSNSSTPVFFSIMSSSCLPGGCGAFGRCYQYIRSGFLFSTCVCNSGYRGWGCTDDTEAVPSNELLMATLLLTLSNILFVPAIVMAAYRRYFTEALVYSCTMLFSALYHACDEEAFSLCLIRLNVLQFCDFYSAILAFWVTLLAMAHLPTPLISILHMAGAIGVALGIEYDRTGLAVFMVPTVTGIVIMSISWIFHGKRSRACFPSKKYWLIYLPPGLILAVGGLICYAFFETEQNYKFVHSVWHATMALSIVFFLPLKRVQTERTKLTWRGLDI